MRTDLYNNEAKLDRLTKQIKDWDYSAKNKEYIHRFLERLQAERISAGRRYKYLLEIKNIIRWHGKDLDDVTKDDAIKIVIKFQSNGYKERTIEDYKICYKKLYWTLFNDHSKLKEFCDWLYDKRNKYFKNNFKVHLQEKRGEPLTEEEFEKVINCCNTIRDKCLLALVFEAGLRPSELLGIRIKDIYKNDYGFKIEVAGKTGIRPVFIVKSAPHLAQWLNSYQNKKKDSFLFINLDRAYKGRPMGLRGANKVFENAMKSANIDKPDNLYFLRSSAVTRDNIKGMSRGAMEKKYGWISGTKVLRSYDRSTAKDYENEQLRMNGIVEVEKQDKINKCERCGSQLGYGEKYCINCGLASKEQQTLNKIKEFLMQPQVMELAKEFLRNKNE